MQRLPPAYSRPLLDIFRDSTVAALMEVDGIPDFIFEEMIYQHGDKLLSDCTEPWPS